MRGYCSHSNRIEFRKETLAADHQSTTTDRRLRPLASCRLKVFCLGKLDATGLSGFHDCASQRMFRLVLQSGRL